MKKTWIVIALAAAFCAACDDDNADQVVCVDGQSICSNGARMTCSHNEYVLNACPLNSTCSGNGECVANTDGCVDGTKYCDGSALVYCSLGMWKKTDCSGIGTCDPASLTCISTGTGVAECTNGAKRCGLNNRQICSGGKWVDSACNVAAGEYCSDGECVMCTSGQKKCGEGDNANATIECQNGQWVTTNVCTGDYACESGKCVDQVSCSKEGATKCGASETIMTCSSGKWATTSVCASSGADRCVYGECVDSKIPQEGDKCDGADYTGFCNGKAAHYCVKGTIWTYKCASNEVCYVDGDEPDCAETCSKVGDVKKVCTEASYSDGSKGLATFVYKCQNTSSGLAYAVDYNSSYTCDTCNAAGDDCGSSSGGGSSSGYEDCSSETCTLQDGSSMTCGQACKELGGSSEAKAWCDAKGSVSCTDPSSSSGGGSSSGYDDCSSETCTLNDGSSMACGQACKELAGSSEAKAWCDAKGNVSCTDPSGSSSGGSSSGYDDCSSETCTLNDGSSMACGQACKELAGSSEAKAWCDASGNVSCTDPSGSSSGGSSSDTYFDCGDDEIDAECKASGKAAYCFNYSGSVYYSCAPLCTSVGSKTTLCDTDNSGSYTYPAVCTQVGDNKVYVDGASSMSDYVDCSSTCNAAGTACK